MVDFAAADTTIETIVRALVEQIQPELILLFGSRAYGSPREDSDYDLMLVLRDPAALEQAHSAAHEALRTIRVSADVVVNSVDDYERHQQDPGFLSYLIAREGRVLYTTGAVPQRSASVGRVSEPRDGEGLALWIKRANSDLRGAESSLVSAEPSWDAVCFHSHACIEKLLKALIVRAGTFPPRTHELKELLAHQPPGIRDDATIVAACSLLMALYPRSRYAPLPEPTPEEAHRAIGAARHVRALLLAWLSA